MHSTIKASQGTTWQTSKVVAEVPLLGTGHYFFGGGGGKKNPEKKLFAKSKKPK